MINLFCKRCFHQSLGKNYHGIVYTNTHFQEMKAIRLDATQRQSIDLGMQDVCLAQPDCGSEGGALSMWVKVGTGGYTGIITSRQNAYPVRGFTLGRSGNYIM